MRCSVHHKLDTAEKWRRVCCTWSPRLRPASAALLPDSTASMKMRKPFSWPPRRLKASGESLDGLVSVTNRGLALAAHAIFNSLRCPHIFWKEHPSNVNKWGGTQEHKYTYIYVVVIFSLQRLYLLLSLDCFRTLPESESWQGRPQSHWSDCLPTARLPV